MLTRLYVDNFCCFVDFEYIPGTLEVLTGRHGSGKSSLLSVLERVAQMLLASEHISIWDVFPMEKCTLWRDGASQSFAVEVTLDDQLFAYRFELSHGSEEEDTRIVREELLCDEQLLFSFADGVGQLHDDSVAFTKIYTSEGTNSALGTAMAELDHPRLEEFAEWCESQLCYVQPGLENMVEYTSETRNWPDVAVMHFASWYRHMVQEHPDRVAELNRALVGVIDRFVRLELVEERQAGAQCLQALLQAPGDDQGKTVACGIESLSAGEQMLIQLYSLAHFALQPDRLLCIDPAGTCLEVVEYRRWLEHILGRAQKMSAHVFVTANQPEIYRDFSIGTIRHLERPDGGATTMASL